jgi:heptosyltransferase II
MARLRNSDALLVRLPNWLGDFVMAEPVVDSLAQAARDGRIRRLALVAPERFYDLFSGRFEGVARLAPGANWRGFDAALFLDGSLGSVLRALRFGIHERWGWNSGARGIALTSGFNPARERGRVPVGLGVKGRGLRALPRYFANTANELVCSLGVPVVDRSPRLASSTGARSSVAARLREFGVDPSQPYWALDASARPDSAKAPGAELWAAALRRADLDLLPPIVLLSAPGEGSVASALAQELQHPNVHLFDDLPPTLGELLALIEGCEVFLGPDSGPRHLATACDKPQVILCGPTDPRHTCGDNGKTKILRIETGCGPCHLERCPLPEDLHKHCMGDIDPAAIAAALHEVHAWGSLHGVS